MYQAVFHIDDKKKIQKAIGNTKGVATDFSDANVQHQIKWVINGTGVLRFTKENNEYREQIEHLLDRNLQVAVCKNSLLHFEIKPSEIIDGIEIVPTAVGELIRKQVEGWAYIKI